MAIFIIGNILPVSLLEHNGAQSIDPSVAHGMIGGTFALNLLFDVFFYDVYWDLEPRVDLTKPENREEAEVGGGVHGGDLVRDALLLSVVHLAIITIVVSINLAIIIIVVIIIIIIIIIIIMVRQRPRV